MRFQIRPKLRSKLTPVLAAATIGAISAAVSVALGMAVSSAARADELTTPPAPTAAESANRPARGMSMDKVEAAYGAPSNRSGPVGEPPISRWEYPGFVVYFEHQFVIHTVGVG